MNEKIKVYCDGGARGNPGPGAAAFVIIKDSKVVFKNAAFLGETTNNLAEYNSLLMALKWLLGNNTTETNAKEVHVFMDSELVIKQLKGEFKVKNEKLKKLHLEIKEAEQKINKIFFYKNIPRAKNRLADFLVNKKLDEVR